jgi:hypothetical protein
MFIMIISTDPTEFKNLMIMSRTTAQAKQTPLLVNAFLEMAHINYIFEQCFNFDKYVFNVFRILFVI